MNWHYNGGGDDDDNDNYNDNYNDNEGYIVWIMNWHYWVLNLGILSQAGEGAGDPINKSQLKIILIQQGQPQKV